MNINKEIAHKAILIPEIENEENSWKNIVFLPFNEYWEVLVIGTIIINYLISLTDVVFDFKDLKSEIITNYLCEIVFFINTATVIAHR